MTTKRLILATAAGLAGYAGAHLLSPSLAHAQSATSGAIQGVVVDEKKEPLAGVTIIVTSPSLGTSQTALSDDKGFYKISDLPPGDYLITFYYLDFTVQRSTHVGLDVAAPVYQTIDTSTPSGKGEKIIVKAHTSTIDPSSTTQGITLDKNYIKNIPFPGRTFDATLGAAAGSTGDAMGVAFSGSTSLENQYFVDGVNTTGLTYGTVGSPLVNDFIEEIEVITGGYNAEYGRATGGIVNVVTKSGSNEFKGSIFGFWQPGFLTAAAKTTPVNSSSIDITANVNYQADLGFELGGPIIKDKLWFFVGFDPAFQQVDYTRTTKSQTDCRKLLSNGTLSTCNPLPTSQGGNADGIPDVDPKTGFFITDQLDSEIRSATSHTYNFIGKLNYAANPENQGQLTFSALPTSAKNPGLLGPANQGGASSASDLTTDVSAKWTSKFNDNKTEIEGVVAWHRDYVSTDALDPAFNNSPAQILINGNLGIWGPGFGAESAKTNAGCEDNGPNDKYKEITNCPMNVAAYAIGGYGSVARDTEDRKAAKISITERVNKGGNHEIKAGIDFEDNTSDKARLYSGGSFIQNDVGGDEIDITRWVQLSNTSGGRFNSTCHTPNPAMPGAVESLSCDILSGQIGSPGTQVTGETLNVAAYLRDSWQIRPNLTLNAGIRYEEQILRYADFLQNTTDVLTGDPLGKNAMVLNNEWAPRVGLLYDWTKEGRSKIYANWGRFYESIPMDINDRSFGGEVQYLQKFSTNTPPASQSNPTAGQCGASDPAIGGPNGVGCITAANAGQVAGLGEQLIGSSGVLIAPGIKPEYLDEFIAGFEYELLDDLKIGVKYQNRNFGRIIEDVSTDGANTYIIANPGEFDQSTQNALEAQIAATADPNEKAHLQHELTLYEGIRIFDKPTRDYNALQFTLERRFSKSLYVQASYTYSRTEGNYPGSFSPDNGQVDPNISSEYDLIELLANRYGPLPQDHPHYIKLDGYYTFDFGRAGALTTGIRFRALSGTPEEALGSHYLYGPNESFLLPRGELGRTDFNHGLDVQVSYSRELRKNMRLEFILSVYNVYNDQGQATTDDTYAPQFKLAALNQASTEQNANPISGGSYSDLIWLKTIDTKGNETSIPIGRNPDFHNTASRYAPASIRLGARLTF